jgi:hypothetical protein
MSLDPASLPRDPDRLIEMIIELHDNHSRLQAMLETMRRALYGARSERFEADAAQLALDLEDVSTLPVEPPPPKPQRQAGVYLISAMLSGLAGTLLAAYSGGARSTWAKPIAMSSRASLSSRFWRSRSDPEPRRVSGNWHENHCPLRFLCLACGILA